MKEAETNLTEDELLPMLTPEVHEKLLEQIRERREKAKRLYDDAMALKEVDPLKAIALFYQLYELRYRRELFFVFFETLGELIEGYHAGRYLFNSQMPESDTDEMVNLQGSLQECFYRGLQALSGIGKKSRNNKAALQYFQFAAEKGYAPSQCLLGHIFEHNTFGIPENREEAQKWYQRASDQGDPDAQLRLGEIIISKANNGFFRFTYIIPSEASKLLHKAASQGYPRAEYELAERVALGAGSKGSFWDRDNPGSYVVTPIRRESLKWLYLSAIHGYTIAIVIMGEHFDQGIGVKKNKNEAIKWYQLAAEQGHPFAQKALAYYFSGFESTSQININYSYALKWFKAVYQSHLANLSESDHFERRAKSERDRYIEYLRSKLQNFSDRYCLERIINDKKKLLGLYHFNPLGFFEELCHDNSLSSSELDDWLIYLITHYFAEMKLEVQLSIAQKICASERVSPSVAFSLIKFLQFFPEIREEYTKVLEILEKLHGVRDKNGYLALYYARKHRGKNPEGTLVSQKEEEYLWNEAAVKYCQAEIVKSPEEFKSWLEKEIKELESLEKTSVAELNLLHEFYYRLAKIKYEEALALKLSQNSIVSKVASWLFWSTPEPLQITPTIEFLKNIPPEHRRFGDAQILLQKCQEDFKVPLQEAAENLTVGIKLSRGKQD